MSYFDISGATFDENLRKLETSDPAHADVFYALLGQLINNDVALKEAVTKFAASKNEQSLFLLNNLLFLDFEVYSLIHFLKSFEEFLNHLVLKILVFDFGHFYHLQQQYSYLQRLKIECFLIVLNLLN